MLPNLRVHYNPERLEIKVPPLEERIEIVCFNQINGNKKIALNLDLGKQSSCQIIVLVKLSQGGFFELITSQNHLHSKATSNLLCKALVEAGEFVYRGRITIPKTGNFAHAYQRNENLLLSGESRVLSEPSLEILAKDVYCTHGAATSSLDSGQLYYLETRGITLSQAERLLSFGFLLSGLDRLLVDFAFRPAQLKKLQAEIKNYFFKE